MASGRSGREGEVGLEVGREACPVVDLVQLELDADPARELGDAQARESPAQHQVPEVRLTPLVLHGGDGYEEGSVLGLLDPRARAGRACEERVACGPGAQGQLVIAGLLPVVSREGGQGCVSHCVGAARIRSGEDEEQVEVQAAQGVRPELALVCRLLQRSPHRLRRGEASGQCLQALGLGGEGRAHPAHIGLGRVLLESLEALPEHALHHEAVEPGEEGHDDHEGQCDAGGQGQGWVLRRTGRTRVDSVGSAGAA